MPARVQSMDNLRQPESSPALRNTFDIDAFSSHPFKPELARDMNSFLLLLVLLLSFAILILAFFALSSCLGDEIRAAWSGRQNHRTIPTTFGMQYARMMGQTSSHAGWEQIEMQDMYDGADDDGIGHRR